MRCPSGRGPSSPPSWPPRPRPRRPRTTSSIAAASSVRIHVGKSGAFSFAGHKHEVVAPAVSGEVIADPADLAALVA